MCATLDRSSNTGSVVWAAADQLPELLGDEGRSGQPPDLAGGGGGTRGIRTLPPQVPCGSPDDRRRGVRAVELQRAAVFREDLRGGELVGRLRHDELWYAEGGSAHRRTGTA